MIRGLKAALILYGIIHVAMGLIFIVAPHQAAGMFGFSGVAPYVTYFVAIIGGTFLTAGVWFIVAGRDPVRYNALVKFAIMWSVLGVVTGVYSMAQGAVNFSQAGIGIIGSRRSL